MSRIGKLPIVIPAGVNIKVENGVVSVKGLYSLLINPFFTNLFISILSGATARYIRGCTRLPPTRHLLF